MKEHLRYLELYNGRPENVDGRLAREIRTYDFLDNLGIEYQRTDHERADNMEACNEIDAVLGVVICKNLFLCNRQKTNFYLENLGCHPCVCTSSLKMKTADVIEKFLPATGHDYQKVHLVGED